MVPTYDIPRPFVSSHMSGRHCRRCGRSVVNAVPSLSSSLSSSSSSSSNDETNTNDKDNTNDDDNTTTTNNDNKSELFQMVEVTFINAIVQLSKGNADFLKLFIISVKTGYANQIQRAEFIEAVDHLPTTASNRDLLPEEIQLRTRSILAVYHVLHFLGVATTTPTTPTTTITTTTPNNNNNSPHKENKESAVLEGYDLLTADLIALVAIQSEQEQAQEQAQEREKRNNNEEEEEATTASVVPLFDANEFCRLRTDILPTKIDTKLDRALIAQTVRVIYYTLQLLHQEDTIKRKNSDGTSTTKKNKKYPRNRNTSGTGFGASK